MKKFYFAVVLIFVVFSIAFAAPPPESAKSGDIGQGMHMGGFGIGNPEMVLGLVDELKLTSEEMKELQDLESASAKDAVKIKGDIELVSIDIKDEMRKDNPDESKIDALADKLSATGSKMLKLRLDNMLKTKKILTKEQFEKLIAIIESREKHKDFMKQDNKGK
jgi:Spy/CpxP family protein refolding chaperone